MTLSIITINYNNKNGLRQTIESVLSQTYSDYEWIVIDGGSSDGSRELIEGYHEYFSFWCSEPDRGIYNAMNKGIIHAHGDYLLFLNSGDCLYDSTVLKEVAQCFNQNIDVIYGDAVFDDNKREYIKKPEKITMFFLFTDTLFHQSSFIHRSVFENKLYDENYRIVSDWKLWIECFLENKYFKHIPICVSKYEKLGTSSNNELNNKERLEVLSSIFSPAIIDVADNLMLLYNRDLYNPELHKIETLLHTRRIYKRIINGMIRFLEFVDKVLSCKEK